MTRAQFSHLQLGDRLVMRGIDRMRGVVVEVTSGVIVAWEDGNRIRYGEACARLFELAPSALEVAIR